MANISKIQLLDGNVYNIKEKIENATAGNFAELDENGNLTDSGKSAEDFAGAIYKTATPGSIVTIDDGADDLPVRELNVAIDPVQDLHGYDHPWPAGGGVNKCPSPLQTTTTESGLTFTCDGKGECTLSGTASSGVVFNLSIDEVVLPSTVYVHLFNSNYFSSNTPIIDFMNGSTVVDFVGINVKQNRIYNGTTDMGGETINGIRIIVPSGFTGSVTFKLYISDSDAVVDFAPYSNICPISGWTGAKVTRTGKNLFDPAILLDGTDWEKDGEVFSGSTDSLANRYPSTIPISLLPYNGQLTISFDYYNSSSNRWGYVFFYYTDGTSNYYELRSSSWTHFEKTSLQGKTVDRIRFGSSNNQTGYLRNIQFELGSQATSYEPYQGGTYDITFPSEAGTVYGGTLDVTTGELVVNRAYAGLTKDSNWIWNTGNALAICPVQGAVIVDDSNQTTILAKNNMFTPSAWVRRSTPEYSCGIFYGASYIFVRSRNHIASLDDLKAVLGNDTLQVVYELATPVSYTLTPQEVRTLLGINNIWADTGDITELIYPVNTDTAMALYEKANKVTNATAGNFAGLDANGNLTDSGSKPSDFLTQHQDISGKADKVSGATNGNFAGLDANGNLIDSGSKASDFMTRSGVVDLVYPVGSIYMSVTSTSPATLFGGTWTQLKDRFLLGTGDTYSNGATGGAASVSYTPAGTNSGGAVSNHTLTVNEIPSHNHSFTGSEVSTGNESVGHTHNVTDYYATTTGNTAITVAQMPSHNHGGATGSSAVTLYYAGASGSSGPAIGSSAFFLNGNNAGHAAMHGSNHTHTITGNGSTNNHNHSGANTSATRTSTGASANHTHKVTASGSIGNKGGGGAHNHGFTQPTFKGTAATISTMPPYLVVYMWKRTA